MTQRLLLIAIVTLLLFLAALPAIPAASDPAGSASRSLGMVYAGDGKPTPASIRLPAGNCHGRSHCGG